MAGGQGGRNSNNVVGGQGGAGYQSEAGGQGGTTLSRAGAGGGGGAAGGGAGGAGGSASAGVGGSGGAGGVQGSLRGADGGDNPGGNGSNGGGGGGGQGGYHAFTGQSLAGNAALTGGDGGTGGIVFANNAGGGGGGAGGYGAVIFGSGTSGTVLSNTNSASIAGGKGGSGGGLGGSSPYQAGSGGDGGVGVLLAGNNVSFTNLGTGSATGGAGGSSGVSDQVFARSGVGGAGVVFEGANSRLVNLGTVSGGVGGRNAVSGSFEFGGIGNVGGVGVAGTGLTIDNGGTINGGQGGRSYEASEPSGRGGAGIAGSDLIITNTGTIRGGLDGDNAARADALSFTGGTNNLTLSADGVGGSLIGGIGIGGSLAVDAGTEGGASGITLANQIHNYSNVTTGRLSKIGAGSLTLTGVNTYTGGTTIEAGTLGLGTAGAAGSGAISFNSLSGSASAQLVLEQSAQVTNGTFSNTLNDFGDNEALVLRGFAFSGTQSYTVTNGVLTIQGGSGQSQSFTLTNANEPAETTYYAYDDGQGGTLISSNLVCYAQGTCIRTMGGEVEVETLAIGDIVVTASSAHRPIRWIGHRTMTCQGRKDVLPVRIAADAFGEGRPARDLYISPAHAVAVDVLGEVLIPACRLINGTTITQVDVETVTYWHVELDSHDILLAEGLPAESYLDCGNRRFFANADATDLLAAPDARPDAPPPFCRPFHEAGPLVDLVRARLEDRAAAVGWRKVEETFAELHIVADGRTIRPDVEGLTARFVIPAEARDVRLVSATSVPAHVVPGSTDDRHLGVALAALAIDDGLTGTRSIALGDERLGKGFHAVEEGKRWTDGSAVLPVDLWDGCKGSFFLRVTLAGPALPHWVAPGEAAGVVSLVDRRKA